MSLTFAPLALLLLAFFRMPHLFFFPFVFTPVYSVLLLSILLSGIYTTAIHNCQHAVLHQLLLLLQCLILRPSSALPIPAAFYCLAGLATPAHSHVRQIPSILRLPRGRWPQHSHRPLRLRAARAVDHGETHHVPPSLPRPRRHQGGLFAAARPRPINREQDQTSLNSALR